MIFFEAPINGHLEGIEIRFYLNDLKKATQLSGLFNFYKLLFIELFKGLGSHLREEQYILYGWLI